MTLMPGEGQWHLIEIEWAIELGFCQGTRVEKILAKNIIAVMAWRVSLSHRCMGIFLSVLLMHAIKYF